MYLPLALCQAFIILTFILHHKDLLCHHLQQQLLDYNFLSDTNIIKKKLFFNRLRKKI